MQTIKNIFDQLQSTTSRKEKEEILLANKNNQDFKTVLHFLLNSYITTGISAKKISKKINFDNSVRMQDLFELLDYIQYNTTGRDEDIAICQNYIATLDDEFAEFTRGLITKSLKLGIDAKTANKVYGKGFIPTFECMLAEKYFEFPHKVEGKEFTVTLKLDGCFRGDKRVLMSDGTQKPIKDIEVGDHVLSFDENTRTISPNKVINKFYNGKKPLEQWLSIETYSYKGGWKHQIVVTKNHKIMSANGWKEAYQVKVGEQVLNYQYCLSESQEQVLLGSGIGDTNVIKENKDIPSIRFAFSQTTKASHCDVFEKYHKLMKGIILTEPKNKMSGYGSIMKMFNTNIIDTLPVYMTKNENIQRVSYRFTDEILSKLKPLGLAIYYLDDGTLRPSIEDGYKTSNKLPRCSIATNRFNYEDIKQFTKYLYNTYGISADICKDKILSNGDTSYRIDMNCENSDRFYSIISKYVPKSMRYKIPSKYRDTEEVQWWNDIGEYKLVPTKVTSVSQAKRRTLKGISCLDAFDLEVENNHTYIVEGFAVHNCRCLLLKENGRVSLFSRQGQPIDGLVDIEEEVRNCSTDNFVLDGELLISDTDGIPSKEQYKATTKIVRKDGMKQGITFRVFDFLSVSEFKEQKCNTPYSIRRFCLEGVDMPFIHIKPLPVLYSGTDTAMIMKILDEVRADNQEGVMINLNDAPYEFKRTTNLLKVKVMQDCDLMITGFEEGSGRLSGTLGRVNVDYKGNTLGVGGGFSDADRTYFWENQQNLIGRVVKVQYFEETQDKGGVKSLRFPVFKELREEGKEVSYS